ncbi:MAG: hypothetical protein A2138_12140 [Deltaproteobacteria bacterium RBG_16_71_12]|nr:MAG: hypothetical protein A2138_12140 [Deltaproteobacteria bacterium RBG_16_71_12]
MKALLVAALAFLLAAGGAAADTKSRRTTDEALKQKKLTRLKLVEPDLDGDGKKEVVAVCGSDHGIVVALIGEDGAGAVVTQVSAPAGGKEVAKVEVKELIPPKGSSQLVLEVYDDTPDEKVKRVRVYGPDGAGAGVKLKEIFSSKIERSKSKDDRAEWERDDSIIRYEEPRPGWYFEDVEEDGIVEVLVRRQPQIITIARHRGDPVKIVTGVRERRWSWDVDKAKYTEGADSLHDFLPAIEIAKVEASSVWIDPKEEKERKARALSDALMQATNSGKSEQDLKDDVTFDTSDLVKLGADGNLATAWIEGDAKGDGRGEWIELTLAEESTVHMVRVVSGCVDTKQAMKAHNVPESFTIRLDGGGDAKIDRRASGRFEAPVVAFTDDLVKLSDRPWARTTLVFFDGKSDASKVRLTLDKAIKQGKGNRTCISEISVH